MDNNESMVFAGIDGSLLSEAVCDYAAWMAKRINAPLKLLHTIDHHHEKAESMDLSGNFGIDDRDHLLEEMTEHEQQLSKLRIQQGKTLLSTAKNRLLKQEGIDPIPCLQHGGLIESLVEDENSIRALVVGIRGKVHEQQTDKIGAKLEPLIRSLHRPILVVNEAFHEPHNIMIAYDGSEAAEKAVAMVASSPLYTGLTCHLVCVRKKQTDDNLLDLAAQKLRNGEDKKIITSRLLGKAEQELCEYQNSHNIDMTIMGAFSHTRIHDLLLGSFTVKMLVNTKKPLLLLR